MIVFRLLNTLFFAFGLAAAGLAIHVWSQQPISADEIVTGSVTVHNAQNRKPAGKN